VSGDDVDLYQWEPGERYDLIVASLFQMPVDPYEEASGQPARLLGPQSTRPLPRPAAASPQRGRPRLVMHLSIVGQAATSQRLAQEA
jgi:hypothetical protein